MKRMLTGLAVVLLYAVCFGLGSRQAARASDEGERIYKNPVFFWELASDDADASVAFFREVFDWDIRMDDDLGFYVVRTGGREGRDDGYIFTLSKAKLPFMAIYTLVDDIEAKADLVQQRGGHVVQPPNVVIPGGPTICLFNDPSGVTHAMIQPVKKEK